MVFRFLVANSFKVHFLHFELHLENSYQKQRQWFLTIITVQQHQSFYRQQITLTGMMGIGRILHTHKSFSYCWCERIIHKVPAIFQTYSLHHALHTHFFFTDCQYQTVTFSEDGCMSIELVWVLVRVLVWVSFSSSL